MVDNGGRGKIKGDAEMRGVNQTPDGLWRAQYTKGDIKKVASFKNHNDAIEQRKAWEKEYGATKVGGKAPQDITGKKYGSLTVISYAGSRNGRGSLWLCQCDCGNKITVRGDHLKTGKTTSCGCVKDKWLKSSKSDDITGKKYGDLTVIKQVVKDDKKTRGTSWLCKCKCGSEFVTYRSLLAAGDVTKCRKCMAEERRKRIPQLKKAEKKLYVEDIPLYRYKDKPYQNNTSGYRGVTLKNGKYIAYIYVKGKMYRKGGFKTAKEAYIKGRLKLEKEHLPKNKR